MNELMTKTKQITEMVNCAMSADGASAVDKVLCNEIMNLVEMFAEKIDTMYETQDIILGELRKDQ